MTNRARQHWQWTVRGLVVAVASTLTVASVDVRPVYADVTPSITVAGVALDGGRVDSPFAADLSNAATVTGDVTWLVDDAYAGKDSSAPYQWSVALPAGSHKLKARWVVSGSTTAETVAKFTVGKDLKWTPPRTVYEEPGPALKGLWVSADNRRTAVPGLYDWSRAGFGGGTALPTDANVRPEAQCRISATDLRDTFHVVPNDGVDDTAGLQAAVDQIRTSCSPTGAYTKESRILLPAGTLNVSRELHLDADYLIVRGAGSDPATGTHLVYKPDATTRYDTITADGTRWDQDAMTSGDAGGGWIWPGRGLFRVQSRAVATKYASQYAAAPANRKDLFEGTVNDHWVSGLTLRAKPGDAGFAARKGDTVVYLNSAASFDQLEVGGLVNVMAANSVKFYQSMDAAADASKMDNLHMRQQVVMVTAGDPTAKTITLDKPLEYDLPVDSTSDGSAPIAGTVFPSKVTPLVDAVVGVGIENLSFTQAEPGLKQAEAKHNYGNMDPAGAMHGIVFKWAANSWVRGVRSDMTGSHPIVTEVAANLSIVDNSLNGSWNKGKGGNGYLRGSRVWDSVYSGNTTRDLRHFTFQWSASGNVAIGNSFDSDLNLHGGYERNNLFERNEVSVPYDHRPGSCQTNCGDEGGSDPDDSDWYPIWWAAGQKAVKWSGSSGPNNVFFANYLRKQSGNNTTAYQDYAPYGTNPHTVYQFGGDAANPKLLDQGGTPIADWAHNETKDYTGGHGVVNTRTDAGRSLFLRSLSLSGYAGPHPQPLRRTWGCKCWDGRGYVNTRLAADPVNTATGSLMETFVDLSLPGPGVPLTFGRTYNSLDATDGPLSPGWTFAFNTTATAGTGNTVMIRDDTGGQTQYHHETDGHYTAVDPGVTATLADRAGGGWSLTNLDHAVRTYSAAGQLVGDVDDQGHGVTLGYAGGRLATVTDTLGQTLTVTWGTTGAATGRITEVTASDGHSASFGYTGTHLTSTVGVDARTTSYTYDTVTGLLNGITDPLNHTTAKTVYDPTSKRVTQQTDAAGGVWHFDWDATTGTATVTDPAGTRRQDVYDGNVLVAQIGPDGRAGEIHYEQNNQPILAATADQQQVRNEYDARGNLLKRYLPQTGDAPPASESWTYDGADRVTAHTDPLGNTTGYAYDGQGRLSTTTLPGGATRTLTYTTLGQVRTSTDERGKTTTFEWNAAGDLVKATSPGGAVTTYAYEASHNKTAETDPRGNVAGATAAVTEQFTTHWTYDAAGRVLTETDGLDHTTTYTYDAVGNVLTVTAPNDGVTTYTYDEEGRQLTVTDTYNHVTRNTYDAGRLASTTAADGGVTTYRYDTLGRLASRTDPLGNVSGAAAETVRQHTVSYSYDAAGNQTQARAVDPAHPDHDLVATTRYDGADRPVAVTDATGATTTTDYDPAGNAVRTTDPTGAVSTAAYDARNRVATTTEAGLTTTNGYDPAGNLTRSETGAGAATTYGYDDDGRMTSVVEPRGNAAGATPTDYTTRFGYDPAGNRTTVTDPLGNAATTYYDAADQVTKVLDPDNHATSYGHDSAGHVNKVTTATNDVTQYAYDKVGQLKTVTTPLTQTYTYGYDNLGRLTSAATPEGRTTGYGYDKAGELTTVTLPAGTVTRTYDAAGRPTLTDYSGATPDVATSYDPAGRPLTITANGAATGYGYDDAGRVTAVTQAGATIGYHYDQDGRLDNRVYPDGRAQAYSYGADGLLTGVTLSGSGGTAIGYGYDPAGQLTSTTRQNGPTTTSTYDRAGRLATVTDTAGGTTLRSQTVGYGKTERPTSLAITRGATTTRDLYSYDDAGRLTGDCRPTSATTCVAGSPGTTWGYDANGNRAAMAVTGTGAASTSYGYDRDDRLLTATTGGGATTTYSYDGNGQLAGESGPAGTRTYGYGLDGNLYTATVPGTGAATFTYDALGDRTGETAGGATTTWTWDTVGPQPTRISQGTTDKWWVDPQTPLGTAIADDTGTGRSWLLPDTGGSITDTTSATALTATTRFDPYGQQLSTSGTGALGFQGQYLDPATGRYDLRARDYDPATGRFAAADPSSPGADGSFISTYHYGHNTPTVESDPSGQCWVVCTAIAGAIIGGAYGGYRCVTQHESCWKDVTTGVVVGTIAGAAIGLVGASALSLTATLLSEAAISGAASVADNGVSTIWNGGAYSPGQAGQDFAWGAATGLVGGAASRVIGRAAGAALARYQARNAAADAARAAEAWKQRNTPGPRPADPGQVQCADGGNARSAVPTPRGAAANGGFAHGITADEILAINRSYGGSTQLLGRVDTVLANAARQSGFYNKAASILRDVAGRHLFDNGNKRTAQAVVESLMDRNGITSGPDSARLREVVNQIGSGQLRDVSDIAAALRGYR